MQPGRGSCTHFNSKLDFGINYSCLRILSALFGSGWVAYARIGRKNGSGV